MKKAVLGIDFGTSHSWFTLKYENSQGKTVVTHLNDRVSSNLDSKGIPSIKDGKSLKSNLYFVGLTASVEQETTKAKEIVANFFNENFASIRKEYYHQDELKVLKDYAIDIIVGKPVQYKDSNYVKFIKEIIIKSFIGNFERTDKDNVRIHVIDEPVLAAYALLKNERIDGNVLVIDIGAGTMDWALLENGNRGYNIIPGGESFDHAGNHFNQEIKSDLNNEDITLKDIIEIKEALNLPKEHNKIMKYAKSIASQQYNQDLSELNTDKRDECVNKAYKIYCEKLRRTKKNGKYYVVDKNQLEAVPELQEKAINSEYINILENGTGGSSLFNEILRLTATDIYESDELKKRRGQAGPQKVLLVGGSSNIIELFKYIKHGCVDNLGWENTTYVRIADQKFGEATCANAVAYGACFVPDYVIEKYTKKGNEDFIEGKKAFDKENYKKALTSFLKVEKEFEGKALLKDDDYAKSLYYIAEIYSKQNKSEEANKYYKKARIAFIKLDDKKMVEECVSKIK